MATRPATAPTTCLGAPAVETRLTDGVAEGVTDSAATVVGVVAGGAGLPPGVVGVVTVVGVVAGGAGLSPGVVAGGAGFSPGVVGVVVSPGGAG